MKGPTKGPVSRKRVRPTLNSSQSFGINENILHSTALDSNEFLRPFGTPAPAPIIISAPSNFPYFCTVLQQNDYTIGKPRNHIVSDQMIFRKKLTEWYKDNRKSSNGAKFIEQLDGYLSQKDNLLHSLTPTSHPEDVFQNSLLHNLLTIPSLQPYVTKVIVPVITDAAYNGRTQEDLDLLSCILTQMKWLPELKDATGFVNILLETTESATSTAQKEIIRLLPDIVPESRHNKVVGVLKNMLQNDSEIVPCILDAFSSLDIPDSESSSIREIAMRQMLTAPLNDFPAYFAFLFRAEDPVVLDKIISDMRDSLELTAIGSDVRSAPVMVEIVEKLRFCSSVNSKLVPVWSKQVKLLLSEEKTVKPLDLIVLLIFAETSKAPLEPLKLILMDGKLTSHLLKKIIHHNLPMVVEVFSTFFKICESILRSKDPRVVEHVVIKLFLALSPLESQDIIGTLTTILVNEGNNSRESVLRILIEVTKKDPKKVLMFASKHLMAVLEYVKKFPTHQIRYLMNILATVAHLENNPDSDRFGVEFSILLRKQLTHTHSETRCFGVLGALATVSQLCTSSATSVAKIKELIDLTWNCVRLEEESCGIFFDELSRIVSRIPPEILNNLQTILMHSFMNTWTSSEDKAGSSSSSGFKKNTLKLIPTYNALFNSSEYKNLEIVMESKSLGMNPVVIPSHFRLLRLLTFEKDHNLSKLKMLFGSAIRFPDVRLYLSDPDLVTKSTYNQRAELGQYIVLLINYFRECVSAFAEYTDKLLRTILWYRLSCIVKLQEHLVLNFTDFPSLPLAYACENTNNNIVERPPRVVPNATGKGKGKGKGRSKTSKEETTEPPKKKLKKDPISKSILSSTTSKTVSSKALGHGSIHGKVAMDIVNVQPLALGLPCMHGSIFNLEKSIQPPFLRPYLRRLDVGVFELLRGNLGGEDDGDSEPDYELILQDRNFDNGSTQDPLTETFSAKTLGFLLLELYQEIQEKSEEFSVLNVRYLIGSIVKHLNVIEASYKDSPELISSYTSSCLLLLLKILCIYCEKSNEMQESEDKSDRIRRIIRQFSKGPGGLSQPKKLDPVITANSIAEYFKNLSCCTQSPAIAVEHLKCLVQFLPLVERKEPLEKALVKLSKSYLKIDSWSQVFPAQVEYILKIYLKYSKNTLECIEKLMDSVFNLEGTIPCDDVYRTCKLSNCQSWYSILFSTLSQYVSKNAKGADFTFWKQTVAMFDKFVKIAANENVKQRNFTTPLFKNAKQYIETFVSHGVKMIPLIWNNDDNLNDLIKPLQTATRKLQQFCTHSKVARDLVNIRRVPLLKKALESLVFRVREVMSVNGAENAFTLGALKHRNLEDSLINSQPYEQASDDELDDDEDGEKESSENNFGSDVEDGDGAGNFGNGGGGFADDDSSDLGDNLD